MSTTFNLNLIASGNSTACNSNLTITSIDSSIIESFIEYEVNAASESVIYAIDIKHVSYSPPESDPCGIKLSVLNEDDTVPDPAIFIFNPGNN